jgi:membrane-bound lytic murein transglycosylase A
VRSRIVLALVLVLIAASGAVAWWFFRAPPEEEKLRLSAVRFADLPSWSASDASAALAAFRRSCVKIVMLPPGTAMAYAGTAADWRAPCEQAAAARDARGFFESAFSPYAIGDGLVTGYYEPLLNGRRTRHGAYQTPVYGVPDDLITIDLGRFRPEWKGERIAGRLDGRRLLPFPSRAEIDRAPPKARVLFYGDDAVAVFFLHIQGSGRVWLDDGSILRVNYAGQNGQPYTPIGRTLIRNYGVPREGMSMQVIAAWLKAHPSEARKVMESDASFVFFEERPVGDAALGPEGTQGVALTPKGSIAVDAHIHPFGVPVYIAGEGLANLFVAQDTGGAIRGAARADIFFGFGASAEGAAGTLKAQARFYVLLPKGVTPKLAP